MKNNAPFTHRLMLVALMLGGLGLFAGCTDNFAGPQSPLVETPAGVHAAAKQGHGPATGHASLGGLPTGTDSLGLGGLGLGDSGLDDGGLRDGDSEDDPDMLGIIDRY